MPIEDAIVLTRTDVLPGHTLTALGVPAFIELQNHFGSNYLKLAAIATEGLSPLLINRVLDHASKVVRSGAFRYGTNDFDDAALSFESVPFILYLCLKPTEPKTTPVLAALLITDENRIKVRDACLELAGYKFKKNEEPPVTAPPTNPSIS